MQNVATLGRVECFESYNGERRSDTSPRLNSDCHSEKADYVGCTGHLGHALISGQCQQIETSMTNENCLTLMNCAASRYVRSTDETHIIGNLRTAQQGSSECHLLTELLASSIICSRDWEAISPEIRSLLAGLSDEELLAEFVDRQLLTTYQAGRILTGSTFGLILGNYRVLERLGAGMMGVVFKAEHLRLPRQVAIKVISVSCDEDPRVLQRFDAEIWCVAQMQHPNIVGAIDAGVAADSDSTLPRLHYFVMDYVPGENLEDRIVKHGPVSPTTACDLIYQIASALQEADKFELVHRDIKPSNILVTPEGQAKLLDFGLARHVSSRLTEPGAMLGTLDYLAPEQARDAGSVDIRADIFGLGCTLFWCLTGQTPFPSTGKAVQDLLGRLRQSPPSVRKQCPTISAELESVLMRMMALDPNERFQTPQEVMQVLVPFLRAEPCPPVRKVSFRPADIVGTPPEQPIPTTGHRILIVDDEPIIRSLCRHTLEWQGMECDEAPNGMLAWDALQSRKYDLVLTDNFMPELDGLGLLRRLSEAPPSPHLKVIMFSGRASAEEMAQMLSLGADDYLTKPLCISQFLSRVKAALSLKDAQDKSDSLNAEALRLRAALEANLFTRKADLARAQNAIALALSELIASRDTGSRSNLTCVQKYCRCLAETAARSSNLALQLDRPFIRLLECCAPLRDIGKVAVPDHILSKPGPLESEERLIMQTHTVVGAEIFQKLATQEYFGADFLEMARDVAHHHHERFDGKGYPDQLVGNDIPLAARIVAIVDAYDSLRSRRPYKPALSHAMAVQAMTEMAAEQFDPQLWQAFLLSASAFEGIPRIKP